MKERIIERESGKEAERETAERIEGGNIFVPGTSEARFHGLGYYLTL